jgi:hypothetical protein
MSKLLELLLQLLYFLSLWVIVLSFWASRISYCTVWVTGLSYLVIVLSYWLSFLSDLLFDVVRWFTVLSGLLQCLLSYWTELISDSFIWVTVWVTDIYCTATYHWVTVQIYCNWIELLYSEICFGSGISSSITTFDHYTLLLYSSKEKCKAIPLQAAWTGCEGSMKLRLPDFKIIYTWK